MGEGIVETATIGGKMRDIFPLVCHKNEDTDRMK